MYVTVSATNINPPSWQADIQSSVDNLDRRYDNLVRLAARKKNQLEDKKNLLTFFKNIDECIDWIEEKKKPLLAGRVKIFELFVSNDEKLY